MAEDFRLPGEPGRARLTRRGVLRGGALGLVALVFDNSAQARPLRGRQADLFASRSDLRPPTMTVVHADGDRSGYILLAALSGTQCGPAIFDPDGQLIWFRPLPQGQLACDFRVQRYRGAPVLTWWEGRGVGAWGEGEFVIADRSYRELRRFPAANRLAGDLHEFVITSRGTALVGSYRPRVADLAAFGGPQAGKVIEGVIQEIDIASGAVVFEWHSLDHVRLDESYRMYPTADDVFDYFHFNSIGVDQDGHLLISARHTSAIYKVHRRAGTILWRLGGKRSDFRIGADASFAFQHDARGHRNSILTLFDNQAYRAGMAQQPSRAVRIKLDTQARTATLIRSYPHPDGSVATKQGNAQQLEDGGLFVGWGGLPSISEFSPAGDIRFHATLSTTSYRAYRSNWIGRPAAKPAIAVVRTASGAVDIAVSWNGATEIARWQIIGGVAARDLKPIASVPRTGFETTVHVPRPPALVAATALDATGKRLATSGVVAL